MEVASPLPISHNHAGTKRSYAISPFLDDPESNSFPGTQGDCSMGMEDNSHFMGQPFKRRRFTEAKPETPSKPNFPIFSSPSQPSNGQMFSNSPAQPSSKRSRSENGWNQSHAKQQILLELKKVVDQQAAEIERLKAEKQNAENTFTELRSQHEKIAGENRILKKAVTIQQERQNQAAQEIQAALKYRVDAEERIRRLEQMNLNLQYRLQSQGSCTPNDFMGFNPRPPDVY